MSNALLLFVSTFICVFALGLQSLNVNQGHYWAAASTSLAISTGNIFILKYMPDSGALEWVGYYLGGVTGIVASMWFHSTVKAWWRARRDRRSLIKRGPPNPVPACKSRPKGFPGDEHASSIYPD